MIGTSVRGLEELTLQYTVPEQLTLYYKEPVVPPAVTARKLPLEVYAFLNFPSVFLSKVCYIIRSIAHISNINITLTMHICIVIKYGIIFPVTLPNVGRFSIYKRKSLELWLVHNPEIHAEVYKVWQ